MFCLLTWSIFLLSCHYKWSWTGWFKTEIYSLTVLEVNNPKSSFPLKGLEKFPSLILSSFWLQAIFDIPWLAVPSLQYVPPLLHGCLSMSMYSCGFIKTPTIGMEWMDRTCQQELESEHWWNSSRLSALFSCIASFLNYRFLFALYHNCISLDIWGYALCNLLMSLAFRIS